MTIPPPDSGLTPDDVTRARDAWVKACPPRWRSLFDAKVEPKKEDNGQT